MGFRRDKTLSPAGALQETPPFVMGREVQGALAGRILFGKRAPMALPWAASELPLRGVRTGGSPH